MQTLKKQTTYVTKEGQAWDQIAYELYGNERYCDKLMDANRDKLDFVVFPEGIVLKVPAAVDVMASKTLEKDSPHWRSMMDGN
ncbi:MAG: phage tail protein [Eubacteriales bacterium]|nr:phage tail protein [Eubacteriales bacterium]